MNNNWLHIDLKGAIPAPGEFIRYLAFWKDCGYNGIVFEYDDRIPWRSWPEACNPGYNIAELGRIHDAARALGLEIVPLIQTHGHLEWLLKLPEYRHWRENNTGNEICPLHPEVRPRLKAWIDEVAELHPDSKYIHLGGDETFHLGTCPQCLKYDKMSLYTDHIAELCRYAVEKGLHPLIWADMFLHEKRIDSVERLPPETILVDWQYNGKPPYESLRMLKNGTRRVMGASGAMTGWWEHCYRLENDLQGRIDNVSGWHTYGKAENIGVIHTTWTRAASLWNIYGPWHGAVPVFIAGGSPGNWAKHPWRDFVRKLSPVMTRDVPSELRAAAAEVLALPAANPIEAESRRWWNLALRYQAIYKQFLIDSTTRKCLDRVVKYVGRDETMYYKNAVGPFMALKAELESWELEARQFWRDNTLSNEEEFFDTRSGILKHEISACQKEELVLC